MVNALENAWAYEKRNHLGDYGDSCENDIYCSFKAGWLASKRHTKANKLKKRDISLK